MPAHKILSPILNLNKGLLSKKAINKCLVFARLCSQGNLDYSDIFKHYSDHGPISTVENRPLTEQEYSRFISKRSALREPAITRQITALAYTVGKDFLSLAEGMPNEDVFPFESLSFHLKDGQNMTIEGKELSTALQYVPTQGMPVLLSQLQQLQVELHRPPHWELRDMMVTSGGQFGLYAAVDLLLEPGDPILIPQYTYTGFHSVLRTYQPEILSIPEDDDGIIPEVLESILTERRAQGLKMPRLLYVVPTGSNPSGTVLPEQRRRRLYELACEYDLILLEDDPYMFMNYTDTTVPSFLSLDVQARVVRVDSFSKVLSPGLRTGWITAPVPLLKKLELHLQGDHLHTCTVAQALISSLLRAWGRQGLAGQLRAVRRQYRARRDALHEALTALDVRASWTLPQAGLFLWVEVNVPDLHHMVFKTAYERGLMLVPGQASLFDSGASSPRLRLAFSKLPVRDISKAAELLAEVLRDSESKQVGGEDRSVRVTQS